MKKHTIRPSLDLKSASAPQPARRISMWPFQSPRVFNVGRPSSRSEKLLECLRGAFNDGGGGRGRPPPGSRALQRPSAAAAERGECGRARGCGSRDPRGVAAGRTERHRALSHVVVMRKASSARGRPDCTASPGGLPPYRALVGPRVGSPYSTVRRLQSRRRGVCRRTQGRSLGGRAWLGSPLTLDLSLASSPL